MANQMLRFLDNYNRRIQVLRSQGDQLLESIKSLEIGMNRRKQQHQQIHMTEIDWLYSMAKNLFEMLAEIKTCEYFKLTHKLVNFDDDFYKKTCRAFFRDLVRQINAKLNAKRLNANNQIDFSIHS